MSGYLLHPFSGGIMTEPHITTHVEDINMVRQLIALVKQRPCIGGHGISRACAIGYAELTVMERSLKSALDKMDLAVKALTSAKLPESGIHADDERVRFSGETYLDRMPSYKVKDILNAMREYETACGAYFNAEAFASWVNMDADWALQILKQLEDSGDVLRTHHAQPKPHGTTLWHVLQPKGE